MARTKSKTTTRNSKKTISSNRTSSRSNKTASSERSGSRPARRPASSATKPTHAKQGKKPSLTLRRCLNSDLMLSSRGRRVLPKLIVTIPAYNEVATIGAVIKSVPRRLKGVKKVEVLVWSDGSTDETLTVAKKAGADHLYESKRNLGLARTFDLATSRALELGADLVVNTDGDNQYDQGEIGELIAPILSGHADVVNGNRQVESLDHMPTSKKYGNRLGSWVIRLLTKLEIADASSGFRAYSARAIRVLHIFSRHTYTHETLIQAAFGDLKVVEVPVTFKGRPGGSSQSRLIKGVADHIMKSGSTIVRTILMYKALKVMFTLGLSAILVAGILGVRYVYLWWTDDASGHVQSLILASMLFNFGLVSILMGVVADLIAINRKISDSIKWQKKFYM